MPPVKPNWADLTDAGPGVGVSNFEVKFRDAELARVHKSDYRIRVHRSRGDSGQNEAERTNSAIGDSVVDGGTIDWNFYKRFDDLTDQEIAEMTPQGFEVYEKSRMSKNAWRVAEMVRERVDDAPVLGDFITALLAEKNEANNFFSTRVILRNTNLRLRIRNRVSLEVRTLKKFYDSSIPITKLVSSLWSTCTVTVLQPSLNVVHFVLTKDGQVQCP